MSEGRYPDPSFTRYVLKVTPILETPIDGYTPDYKQPNSTQSSRNTMQDKRRFERYAQDTCSPSVLLSFLNN